jgi:hypothetical protein
MSAATAPNTPDASDGQQQPGPSKPTELPAASGNQVNDGPKLQPGTTAPAEPVCPAKAAPASLPQDTIPAKTKSAWEPENTETPALEAAPLVEVGYVKPSDPQFLVAYGSFFCFGIFVVERNSFRSWGAARSRGWRTE